MLKLEKTKKTKTKKRSFAVVFFLLVVAVTVLGVYRVYHRYRDIYRLPFAPLSGLINSQRRERVAASRRDVCHWLFN